MIQLLFFNESVEDDIKSRNIRQTEILVDLREAILQVSIFRICSLSSQNISGLIINLVAIHDYLKLR